ncbi:hypothetical protein EJ130_02255 [Micrococcus luteus]|uniref:hypothetical protein n=1 Tax=Micrococcus luteus TaxID=1270 RepID=UPI0022B4002A|nr:hypothetical protein [Micrococcus luteus]MCZ6937127.1 hypothetical protein [Micrococcus luteus]
MPIRQFPTTLHNGEQETQAITVLPSQTYSDAAAALDYAQAHGLMIHIEMDPGDWWMTPDEATSLWDALEPGESFTVHTMRTEAEHDAAEDERQERAAERERRDHEAREARRAEQARQDARAAVAREGALSEALATLALRMRECEAGAAHMTCDEAEAVAAVVRIVGPEHEAARFVERHAAGKHIECRHREDADPAAR